jgi:hypothetical protein
LQVDGDWRFDSRRSALVWSIDLIDNTNRSGSLEFVVPACDPEVFYPVEVRLLPLNSWEHKHKTCVVGGWVGGRSTG